MKSKSLQFTLFSKILFIMISVALTFGTIHYFRSKALFAPIVDSKDVMNTFFFGSYILFTICIAVMMIASYFLSKVVTKPLERLVKVISHVGKGNFEVKATEYVKSSDEIGELAQHFDEMSNQLKSRNHLKNILQKLHGKTLTEQFLEGALEKKSNAATVAVLFLDIRNFTSYSEDRSPKEVIEALNSFFDKMGVVVKEHGGIIDKFMGDSLMAIWGVPDFLGAIDVNSAFECALEMKQVLTTCDCGFKAGIGIDYGDVILGCIGSSDQLDYTVIGDVVNSAAKIEKVTKHYDTMLMVSENVKKNLSANLSKMLQGQVTVQLDGKAHSSTLYCQSAKVESLKK